MNRWRLKGTIWQASTAKLTIKATVTDAHRCAPSERAYASDSQIVASVQSPTMTPAGIAKRRTLLMNPARYGVRLGENARKKAGIPIATESTNEICRGKNG